MTSPADRYRVADEDLVEHETHLAGLSGRMRQATQAATPIAAGAYGLIGQIFAARTADAEAKAARAVTQLAQAVGADGTRIKDTRIAYLGNELELSRRMNRTYPQGNDVDMRPGDQKAIPGATPSGKVPAGNGSGGPNPGGGGGNLPEGKAPGGKAPAGSRPGEPPDEERTANSRLKDALDGRREAERRLDRLDERLDHNEQRQNALDRRRQDLEHRLEHHPGQAERRRIERALDGLDRDQDRLDREHDRLERDHRHADRDYERAEREVDRRERADRPDRSGTDRSDGARSGADRSEGAPSDADRSEVDRSADRSDAGWREADRSGGPAEGRSNTGPAMQLGGVPQWPSSPTRSSSNQSRREGSRAPDSFPT